MNSYTHLIKFLNSWSLEPVKTAPIASEHSKCQKIYPRIGPRTVMQDSHAAKMGAISSPEVIWGMLIAAATNSIAQSGSVINKANLHTRFYHQRYHSPSTVPHQPSPVPLFINKNNHRYHFHHQRYQKTINGTKNNHHWYHKNQGWHYIGRKSVWLDSMGESITEKLIMREQY